MACSGIHPDILILVREILFLFGHPKSGNIKKPIAVMKGEGSNAALTPQEDNNMNTVEQIYAQKEVAEAIRKLLAEKHKKAFLNGNLNQASSENEAG